MAEDKRLVVGQYRPFCFGSNMTTMKMTTARRQQHEIKFTNSANSFSCWHVVGVVVLLPVLSLFVVSLNSSVISTIPAIVASSSIFDYGDIMLGQRRHHRQRRLTESVPAATTTKIDEIDDTNASFLQRTSDAHLPLFHVSDVYTTIGPTVFPKPNEIARKMIPKDRTTSSVKLVNNFRPTIGKHRGDQDAIFIFAAEYNLNTYILFLSTLQETNYVGDVVIAISKMDYQDSSIRHYLESFSVTSSDRGDGDTNGDDKMNIVVYILDGLECYNAEMQLVDSMKGGIRVCQLNNLYGYVVTQTTTTNDRDDGGAGNVNYIEDSSNIIPLQDPRPARTVPTTRYELYWIWIQHYQSHNWIMLIDARDTIFQSNPFTNLPRRQQVGGGDDEERSSSTTTSGRLYFFGVSFPYCVLPCLFSMSIFVVNFAPICLKFSTSHVWCLLSRSRKFVFEYRKTWRQRVSDKVRRIVNGYCMHMETQW